MFEFKQALTNLQSQPKDNLDFQQALFLRRCQVPRIASPRAPRAAALYSFFAEDRRGMRAGEGRVANSA